MHYFILFVIIVTKDNFQCVTEEMQEVIDMLHNTCKEQTGADEGKL